MEVPSVHTFHIPVMGLAYTIDSPIKVARFGINSVVSIIEDTLIELMREHYYRECKMPYYPIDTTETDYRARRITDYLNLMNRMVKQQVDKLRNSTFEKGSDIVKYFEMLPAKSNLRLVYERMKSIVDTKEKETLISYLRNQIAPGRIDVNIMTKVDKNNRDADGNILSESSDALAALRGYVVSDLRNSSVILSAGLNPRLFNYMEKFAAFQAMGPGKFEKEVVVKVSDYRSALIQGKYLAKKGIWVSEFRIESGLNCGGHAFATDGTLLGPILDEFKKKKNELRETLHSMYSATLTAKGRPVFDHPIRLTVQGGIGTHDEAEFLMSEYDMDSTGWGTPFLLCPEATTVDDETLKLLCKAEEEDVLLSKNSPLGIRFNYLRNTSSEKEKLKRIAKGKPGSPCTEKYLVSNCEFTSEPVCTASYVYQRSKLAKLKGQGLAPAEYKKQYDEVVNKECLCIGLSNAAILKYKLPPVKNLRAVTICPGPNIAYFDKIVTLHEMTDHIYGRISILGDEDRPHMFVKELKLNVDYLKEKVSEWNREDSKQMRDIADFSKQLLAGIDYYRSISSKLPDPNSFEEQLQVLEDEIIALSGGLIETNVVI